MATKKMDRLEKAEEKKKMDLDGDGEKGEAAAHRARVLGKKDGKAAAFGGKQAAPFGKKAGRDGRGKSDGKMCAACKKAGKSSCSHM